MMDSPPSDDEIHQKLSGALQSRWPQCAQLMHVVNAPTAFKQHARAMAMQWENWEQGPHACPKPPAGLWKGEVAPCAEWVRKWAGNGP